MSSFYTVPPLGGDSWKRKHRPRVLIEASRTLKILIDYFSETIYCLN